MPFTLILDVVVAILLVVTIGYAMVLNAKLSRLRRDRSELEALGETFAASTLRAEQGLQRLKETAQGLQENISKAEALREDLDYLIDRGGVTADRLVEQVRRSRDVPSDGATAGTAPHDNAAVRAGKGAGRENGGRKKSNGIAGPPGRASEAALAGVDETGSDAERELLKALRSVR